MSLKLFLKIVKGINFPLRKDQSKINPVFQVSLNKKNPFYFSNPITQNQILENGEYIFGDKATFTIKNKNTDQLLIILKDKTSENTVQIAFLALSVSRFQINKEQDIYVYCTPYNSSENEKIMVNLVVSLKVAETIELKKKKPGKSENLQPTQNSQDSKKRSKNNCNSTQNKKRIKKKKNKSIQS